LRDWRRLERFALPGISRGLGTSNPRFGKAGSRTHDGLSIDSKRLVGVPAFSGTYASAAVCMKRSRDGFSSPAGPSRHSPARFRERRTRRFHLGEHWPRLSFQPSSTPMESPKPNKTGASYRLLLRAPFWLVGGFFFSAKTSARIVSSRFWFRYFLNSRLVKANRFYRNRA
jgi:hypothetical protein